MYRYYGLNRTFCDVLAEMRMCDKTKNYSVLPSLIEELQSLGNRMEASLQDVSDLESVKEELRRKQKEIIKLTKEEAGDDRV